MRCRSSGRAGIDPPSRAGSPPRSRGRPRVERALGNVLRNAFDTHRRRRIVVEVVGAAARVRPMRVRDTRKNRHREAESPPHLGTLSTSDPAVLARTAVPGSPAVVAAVVESHGGEVTARSRLARARSRAALPDDVDGTALNGAHPVADSPRKRCIVNARYVSVTGIGYDRIRQDVSVRIAGEAPSPRKIRWQKSNFNDNSPSLRNLTCDVARDLPSMGLDRDVMSRCRVDLRLRVARERQLRWSGQPCRHVRAP